MSEKKRTPITIDDLAMALDWIGTYEPGPDETDGSYEAGGAPFERLNRVSAWLEAEIKRREHAAYERMVIVEFKRRFERTPTKAEVKRAIELLAAHRADGDSA